MVCITANDRSIIKQIVVNGLFFQMEFGINAGFPNFSCRPTQKMNAGTSAKLTLNSAALVGWRMFSMSDVTILDYAKSSMSSLSFLDQRRLTLRRMRR